MIPLDRAIFFAFSKDLFQGPFPSPDIDSGLQTTTCGVRPCKVGTTKARRGQLSETRSKLSEESFSVNTELEPTGHGAQPKRMTSSKIMQYATNVEF